MVDELLLRVAPPTQFDGVAVWVRRVDTDRGRAWLAFGDRDPVEYQLGDVVTFRGNRFELVEVRPAPVPHPSGRALMGPAGRVVARLVRVPERELPETFEYRVGHPCVVGDSEFELVYADPEHGSIQFTLDGDDDDRRWVNIGEQVRISGAWWELTDLLPEEPAGDPGGQTAGVLARFRRAQP
jgi:hypothetical protein